MLTEEFEDTKVVIRIRKSLDLPPMYKSLRRMPLVEQELLLFRSSTPVFGGFEFLDI
jgi:hypothetical protein